MYSSTSMSSNHCLLDCFPAPPTPAHTQTQHVSFPMSHLRHSGSDAAAAAAAVAAAAAALGPLTPRSAFLALPEIDAGSSTFDVDFSSGALGLHISSSSSFDHPSPSPSPSTSSSSSPSYSPPAVISLGEEWTDDDTASDRPASLDVFGDSGSYFAFSPTSSSSSLSLSPELTTEQLPLWQAEHARLLSIRDAVLSSERAARYREACLESEVARIKDDLARVKESRARARWIASRAGSGSLSRRNSAPDASQGGPTPASIPLVRRASDSDVAAHHRATETERHWQQHSSGWFACDDEEEEQITLDDSPAIPAESPGQFWDEDYPDPETLLAHNLTEARSARAEERRRRKRDHERIRELGILLSLGSEVRQWEERLAWENAFRRDNDQMELDHIEVEDTASRRRSKSLPTTPASDGSCSSSSSALTPPLPPLSASPLWRVSAEMILRRRSLSERPRRVTPLTATLESEVPDGASTDFGSSGGSSGGSGSGSSSAKHQAVPPPISITSSCLASSLKTAPSRPSALKLSFTLEDLVAPEEAAVIEKIEEHARQDEEMCNSSEESSDASDSDDSRCKSSSSNSSSSENEIEEKRLALRRGRSRWSWRRSLQSAQQLQLQQQLQQIVVDMEVDDA